MRPIFDRPSRYDTVGYKYLLDCNIVLTKGPIRRIVPLNKRARSNEETAVLLLATPHSMVVFSTPTHPFLIPRVNWLTLLDQPPD
jgi:hypothetical protein